MLICASRVTAVALSLAALLTILPSAQAEAAPSPFYDGNQFLQMCAAATYSTFPCGGYVMGAYDAALGGAASICLPAGARDSQLLDVVVKYLKHNPADRTDNAATLVVDALGDAFPC